MATMTAMRFFFLPALPQFVSEWFALIPLIVHLASPYDEFQAVGDACLRGKFAFDLIPKLGQLKGMAKVLRPGSVIFDQTGGAGALGSTIVWDVSWGSVFQCANGAARELITKHAFHDCSPMVDVETTPPGSTSKAASSSSGGEGTNMPTERKPNIPVTILKKFASCRPQILHLVELRFGTSQSSSIAANSRRLESLLTAFRHLLIAASIIPLFLCGAYGTCASILLSRLNALINHYLPINRPTGYLQNTEHYDKTCMLAAPHENASTWYLYRGDRAIIDWLLNKTMITIGAPEGSRGFYMYFLCSHYLQLLAMTYVAAQKGWDGLFLFLFMIVSSLTGSSATLGLDLFRKSGAATWLHQNNIRVYRATFRMAGRTQMMGAIQLINDMDQIKPAPVAQLEHPISPKGSRLLKPKKVDPRAKWMDKILTISPRRDALLQHLRLLVQTQRVS
jgi:hypothetical protein